MAFDKEKWIEFWNEGASKVKKTAADTKGMVAAKYNLSKLNDDLEELYLTLGMITHQAYSCSDKDYTQEIAKLHENIDAKRSEIEKARTELEIITGKKICSLCGKTMKGDYGYCPYCGEKVSAKGSEENKEGAPEQSPENRTENL